LAELKVRLYADGQYPPALEVGNESDGWADDDHTYNVNKEKVFTNLKQNQMNLRLSPLERDPGVHEMNYVDYILDFTGPGWSSQGKKEFSMSTLNQSPPQVEAFFRAQTVYAVAEEKPVPNMSHLDSKPTVLVNPEVLNVRRITVKSPNGGEKWSAGQTKTITWTALGAVGPVMIVLRKGDAPLQALSPNEAPAMQGSFTWNIPWNLPSGDDYKIRVRNMDNSIQDDSDGPFSIPPKFGLKPGPPKP
jgi:hypothetical protein